MTNLQAIRERITPGTTASEAAWHAKYPYTLQVSERLFRWDDECQHMDFRTEVEDWLAEHVNENYGVLRLRTIGFKFEHDAFAFKLRWL